jgi:hypothetical protein
MSAMAKSESGFTDITAWLSKRKPDFRRFRKNVRKTDK